MAVYKSELRLVRDGDGVCVRFAEAGSGHGERDHRTVSACKYRGGIVDGARGMSKIDGFVLV